MKKMSSLILLLVFSTVAVGIEYLLAFFRPGWSLLHQSVRPGPGVSLSLALGWLGLMLMIVMNIYSVKKRNEGFFPKGPSLQAWFNFHVFCGLLGPIFILFHSNLRVRGLVAVAFWSMWVSVLSGMVGRYLYFQVGAGRKSLEKRMQGYQRKLANSFVHSEPGKGDLDESVDTVMNLSGAASKASGHLGTFIDSLVGDFRMRLSFDAAFADFGWRPKIYLRELALAKRRLVLLSRMEELLGYWRAFHLPFAFFMYGAAFAHVIAELLFQARR